MTAGRERESQAGSGWHRRGVWKDWVVAGADSLWQPNQPHIRIHSDTLVARRAAVHPAVVRPSVVLGATITERNTNQMTVHSARIQPLTTTAAVAPRQGTPGASKRPLIIRRNTIFVRWRRCERCYRIDDDDDAVRHLHARCCLFSQTCTSFQWQATYTPQVFLTNLTDCYLPVWISNPGITFKSNAQQGTVMVATARICAIWRPCWVLLVASGGREARTRPLPKGCRVYVSPKVPPSMRISGPHLILYMVPWAHMSLPPKNISYWLTVMTNTRNVKK